METTLALIPILAVLAMGVISPGRSFILVARTAVAESRAAAVSAAFGMATGAVVLAIAALLGLNALLHQVPSAYLALKVIGGVYLLYLSYKTWRGASMPISIGGNADPSPKSLLRHFWLATATMLSNPKAAVQYGVIFAAMLPPSPSLPLTVALPVGVFSLEASWYLIVAFTLSASKPRNAYIRAKSTMDRTVGVVLGLLGIKLLLSSKS
jgi:threonine/homoserine/homoserine lactone efflux protein